jgi:hypothetical protein
MKYLRLDAAPRKALSLIVATPYTPFHRNYLTEIVGGTFDFDPFMDMAFLMSGEYKEVNL